MIILGKVAVSLTVLIQASDNSTSLAVKALNHHTGKFPKASPLLKDTCVWFVGPVVLASKKQQGDGWIPHANYLLLAGLAS